MFLSRKGNSSFGVFGFFFFLWIFVIVGRGEIEDVRHDVLCLNVFECLFFIQKCLCM